MTDTALATATVVWRARAVGQDTDDPSGLPDEYPLAGVKVRLIPSPRKIEVAAPPGGVAPTTYTLRTWDLVTSADGSLVNLEDAGEGIQIVASDALDGVQIEWTSIIDAPDSGVPAISKVWLAPAGSTVDLTTVESIPPSPGSLAEYLQAVRDARAARDIAVASGAVASAAAEAAAADAERAEQAAQAATAPTDEMVAGLITDGTSGVRDALDRAAGVDRSRGAFAGMTALPSADDAGRPYRSLFTPASAAWVLDGVGLDITPGAVAGYLEVDLGAIVGQIGATWVLDDAGGTLTGPGATVALVTWADGGVAANGLGRRTRCHVTVNNAGVVQLWVRQTVQGPLTLIWATNTKKPLAVGVTHRADVTLVDGLAIVVVDDEAWAVADARIIPVAGEQFACWEPYYGTPALDPRLRITSHWAGVEAAGPGGMVDRLARLAGVALGQVQPTDCQTWTPPSAQDIPANPNTTWLITPLTCSVRAGARGVVVWDIEVPVAQTAGDGEVNAGSLWFGVATLQETTTVAARSRAAWVTTQGVLRRRIITTGHIPGQMVTRRLAVSKDAGGSGTSQITASRSAILSAQAM